MPSFKMAICDAEFNFDTTHIHTYETFNPFELTSNGMAEFTIISLDFIYVQSLHVPLYQN